MTDANLIKSIRTVVKEELEPIKKTLEAHGNMLEAHGNMLEKHTKKLDALWDQTVELTEGMTEIKLALKSNTVDLDQTKKRVTTVEDHLGL